jgi:putative protein-disulfide isomerase
MKKDHPLLEEQPGNLHQQEQRDLKNKRDLPGNEADRITVTYYTDPLCCWSYALQPHWKKLLEEFKSFVSYKYVMGGLIPDWSRYNDPMNSVSKPFQMGPVWMHASHSTNTPIKYQIWHEDPPSSSYPACIAVKCASLQSAAAAEATLESLREAVMLNGLNISNTETLLTIIREIASSSPALLDYTQFVKDWNSGAAQNAFRSDLQQTAYQKIGRFPTITFTNASGKGLIITGYRPYDVLVKAMEQMLTLS